jgi:hypothetical protein
VNVTTAQLCAGFVDIDVWPRDLAHPQRTGGPPQGDAAARTAEAQIRPSPASELASVQLTADLVRGLLDPSNDVGGERKSAEGEDAEVLPRQDIHGITRTVRLDQGRVLPCIRFAAGDSGMHTQDGVARRGVLQADVRCFLVRSLGEPINQMIHVQPVGHGLLACDARHLDNAHGATVERKDAVCWLIFLP